MRKANATGSGKYSRNNETGYLAYGLWTCDLFANLPDGISWFDANCRFGYSVEGKTGVLGPYYGRERVR